MLNIHTPRLQVQLFMLSTSLHRTTDMISVYNIYSYTPNAIIYIYIYVCVFVSAYVCVCVYSSKRLYILLHFSLELKYFKD